MIKKIRLNKFFIILDRNFSRARNFQEFLRILQEFTGVFGISGFLEISRSF
jgi:hypothetical protein